MLRGEVSERNHTTRKKKIEKRLMPEHTDLRGKPSRGRKPTVLPKQFYYLFKIQLHTITLESYIFIYKQTPI
jgi:hypothetical protein